MSGTLPYTVGDPKQHDPNNSRAQSSQTQRNQAERRAQPCE